MSDMQNQNHQPLKNRFVLSFKDNCYFFQFERQLLKIFFVLERLFLCLKDFFCARKNFALLGHRRKEKKKKKMKMEENLSEKKIVEITRGDDKQWILLFSLPALFSFSF